MINRREIVRRNGQHEICTVDGVYGDFLLCWSEKDGDFWAKPKMGHVMEINSYLLIEPLRRLQELEDKYDMGNTKRN